MRARRRSSGFAERFGRSENDAERERPVLVAQETRLVGNRKERMQNGRALQRRGALEAKVVDASERERSELRRVSV